MRLIDADKLLRHQNIRDCSIGVEYIISAPSVDAIPVVRCKDCKYRNCKQAGQPNILCYQMHDDDFCSYGKRR